MLFAKGLRDLLHLIRLETEFARRIGLQLQQIVGERWRRLFGVRHGADDPRRLAGYGCGDGARVRLIRQTAFVIDGIAINNLIAGRESVLADLKLAGDGVVKALGVRLELAVATNDKAKDGGLHAPNA